MNTKVGMQNYNFLATAYTPQELQYIEQLNSSGTIQSRTWILTGFFLVCLVVFVIIKKRLQRSGKIGGVPIVNRPSSIPENDVVDMSANK